VGAEVKLFHWATKWFISSRRWVSKTIEQFWLKLARVGCQAKTRSVEAIGENKVCKTSLYPLALWG
jgi:hypothetical protein